MNKLTLVLSLPYSEKVYKVIPYKNREVLGLEQDLTEHYQALHPDKGIQKVTVTSHLKLNLPPG